MLSLKEFQVNILQVRKCQLLDLPEELLNLIISFLYYDNGGFLRDLIPASMACVRTREASAPFLFRTLHLRLTDRYVDRRTLNIMLNCDIAPYGFARHVRHLVNDDSYCFRANGCEDLRLSNELVRLLVKQGLHALVHVKSVSVACLNSPLLGLLPELFPGRAFDFRIEACGCSQWSMARPNLATSLCESSLPHHFAIAANAADYKAPLEPWATKSPAHIHGISWRYTARTGALRFGMQVPTWSQFTGLRELHLKCLFDSNTPTLLFSSLSSLSDLRRLSITGPAFCSSALAIVNQLKTLESLRLLSPVDRIFHTHLRNHDFEGLPYLRLPHLRSLEIRYISRYLSIEHIVPKGVRHLRIEYHRSERLTPFDLRWIARNAPLLECLEINTGALANLWHPTAIAGVDVDMEVYGMLEALSSFKNLKTLRLFPSYWQSFAGYLHFVQPVADEQAVRVFSHLRLSCRKLQLLIISNSYLDYRFRNEVFSRGLSEPMKWVVRPVGSRTLLLTHEAKKNYHLEQIWEGERRLRMLTVRHSGRKLHFDELEEWTLPTYEFPFDEPVPCHFEATADGPT